MLLSAVLRSKRWTTILKDITNVLLPRVCFGCTTPLLARESTLCTVCRHDLPLTHHNFSEENVVDRIFYGRVPIHKAAAFVFFTKQGIVQNLLHALKYKNQEQIGVFFGAWCAAVLEKDQGLQDIDMVVPIPLHPKKQKRRGYNQVTLFARSIAEMLGVECREDILQRVVHTKTQTQKDRHKRWENIKAAFQCPSKILLKDKHVLLVDDVITTGATIEACARVLLQQGTPRVSVLSIAVAL